MAFGVRKGLVLATFLICFLYTHALAGSGILFTENIWDFGKIKSTEKLEHIFNFINTGDADLVIKNVTPSCGCTAALPEKTMYKPGEKGSIKVKFSPIGHSGKFSSTLMVRTNAQKTAHILTLKADVSDRIKGPVKVKLPSPSISVKPESVNFGTIKLRQPVIYNLVIENKGSGDLFITNLSGENEKSGLALRKKAIKQNKKIELTLFYESRVTGDFEDFLTIKSNDPQKPVVKVKLFGKVE